MGENIKAGIDCLHANGNTYRIIEVRQSGGRTVAMGREVKADGTTGRTVVLALDKLTATEPMATVSAQDMADMTGHSWEGAEPAAPETVLGVNSDMATNSGFVAACDRIKRSGRDIDGIIAEIRSSGSLTPFADFDRISRESTIPDGPTDETHVSAQDMANLTGNGWEGCYPAAPSVDEAHAAFMAADGMDDNPPRTLAPNDEAGPITRDDLIGCRAALEKRVDLHHSGALPMTPGSFAVAKRTLASLARAIGPDPVPSQPGPLGIYDRQGTVKRTRRRRRSQHKAHAPKSLFRARSDRKSRLVVQPGHRPGAGSAFSAN